MVLLGTREISRRGSVLGRETFLVPVRWDPDQWPVASPGIGRVLAVERCPNLPIFHPKPRLARDDFDAKQLGLQWNFVRTPREPFWSLTDRPGWLRLNLFPQTLSDDTRSPAYIARRVEHFDYSAACKLDFTPDAPPESAGIAIRAGACNLRLVKTREKDAETIEIISQGQAERIIATTPAPTGPVYLKITCRDGLEYSFFTASLPEQWTQLGLDVDGDFLKPNAAPGARFTGAYIGMYATSNGAPTQNHADFDYFEYAGN
jgi:alpha-N-arabinofuranosidase